MKRIVTALAVAVGLAAFSGSATAADAASKSSGAAAKVPDGSPVFLQYKCSSCHSIETRGIVKKAAAAEGEAEPQAATTASKPPDLSGVGAVRKAEWISAFLLKQEKLGGKLHIKKFRGTEAELKQLVNWLATLDDPAAAKKLKAVEPEPKAETKSDK